MNTSLKPQDILVVLKLLALGGRAWSFKEFGSLVDLSGGEVHRSLGRLGGAGLVFLGTKLNIAKSRLYDFLVHGVPVAFPAVRGAIGKGMPTASSAPMFAGGKRESGNGDLAIVWPVVGGTEKGESLVPLYKAVPAAAQRDRKLYEFLALTDWMRVASGAKEKKQVAGLLEKRLGLTGESSED